jgi:hypothetical protein
VMAFLSKVAFSMRNFLPTCPGREFAGVDESIQGVALAGSDVLAHRGSLRVGYAGWVPARHVDSARDERSVLAKDGVLARKPVAGPVLVVMCSGPLIIVALKIAGGVFAP